MRKIAIGAAALASLIASRHAGAFCGFYVSGSGEKLTNNATQVVLMRDGTRTVLSMQNDYQGPLEDFAMVVPVPVVLHEADVKTLPKEAFDHTDALGSPRLVEYWEQNPCPDLSPRDDEGADMSRAGPRPTAMKSAEAPMQQAPSVKIEAKFAVGEYQILILSAKDSTGLETWLNQNHYKIPAGAEPLLRPYVESNMKFFVAKVDPKKVQMVNGHAALSPLRFNYDSEDFSLPIRLGMANANGKQDLIVNIISPNKRYEVANYKNVFIPTNFDVKKDVKNRFGEFYAALFDKTVEANPHSVVTEYAWTAVPNYHCDPCTNADISNPDLALLGSDVVQGQIAAGNFVLTRLHARYGKSDMVDDLRFKEGKPVTGGRENWSQQGLEYGATPSPQNYFQARYAVRHYWTGPMACQNPQRNVWGGPPDGGYQQTLAANKIAFAPRGKLDLASEINRDLWEINFKKKAAAPQPGFAKPPTKGGALGGLALLALLGFGAVAFARRR